MRRAPAGLLALAACFHATQEAGTVAGPLGAQIDVPAGAVSPSVWLAIDTVTSGFPAPPANARGPVFAFTPHGLSFAQPVTIKVPAGSGTQLFTAQPGGAWSPVAGVVREGDFLVAQVTHFSFFVTGTSLGRAFIADGEALRVIDLATLSVSTLVPGTPNQNFVTAVAVDPAHQQLYWADNFTDAVSRIGLDGSGSGTMHAASDPLSNPGGVAVDEAGGKLFWVEGGVVNGSKLDGSDVATVVQGAMPQQHPTSVAVDPDHHLLYWTDDVSDSVNVAGYDGSAPMRLHLSLDPTSNPRGIAVDPVAARLFWAEGSDLWSSGLAGENAAVFVAGTVNQSVPTGIALEPAAQRVYWTDNGTDALTRIGYDGSARQTLYTNPNRFSNPAGVALAP